VFNSLDSITHTLVVGTLGYFVLIFLLRISGKRTLSKWNAFDFVVTVAFGSVLASLLLSKQTALAQGSLGLALLVGLQFMLTWLSVRSSVVQHLIKGKPTLLFFKGRFQEDALLRERVTEAEIRAAVRSNGVSSLEDVAAVVLETDGTFSVIQETEGNRSDSAMADVQGFKRAISGVQ
jgi:uncharacterized membrane protein YcaP (DUF421 family)